MSEPSGDFAQPSTAAPISTPAGEVSPFDSFSRRLGKARKNNSTPSSESPSTPTADSDRADSAAGAHRSPVIDGLIAGGKSGANQPDQGTTQSGNSSVIDAIAKGGEVGLNKAGQNSTPSGKSSVVDAIARGAAAGLKPDQTATPPSAADPRGASPFDSFSGRLNRRLKDAEVASETPEQGVAAARTPESAGAVGGGEHVVEQGECVSSIAKNSGHFWKTIWEDAANTVLREARKDPNVLLPGDKLHVPELRKKYEPGQTEKRHRFQRRGEPAMLRLTLQVDDVPLGNQPYTLTIDGRTVEGVTDPEGKLVQPIPPNARSGRLVVGEERWEYELDLGHVDPVENLVGVQKRLNNLGFHCGRTDGVWDDLSRAALRELQKQQGIEATGDPDDVTRQRLKTAHGS